MTRLEKNLINFSNLHCCSLFSLPFSSFLLHHSNRGETQQNAHSLSHTQRMAADSGTTSSSSTSTTQAVGNKTLQGVGNLIKLLPSGTVFLFQFLNPVLTNTGDCNVLNKVLSGVLLFVCGFSCCFSCFTDSYTGADGKVYYGIVTAAGLWPFWDPNAASMDFSKYKLRLGDFVHAALSLVVFAVIGLLDSNTVSCYYSSFESNQKVLLMVLPPAIGAVASSVFVLFPNTRHGIGYPTSTDASTASSSSSST
uniref:D-alanine--D-alanine ligase n=1 Tax=Anthurium amnicola TaxID=1678845 RepID=A0A1D1YEE1_9ARAE